MLEFLMPIATPATPANPLDLYWDCHDYARIAYSMELETCQIFLSLPPNAIANRPKLLNWLLKCASPVVVRLLLELPVQEIHDRPGALKFRLNRPPLKDNMLTGEEVELHRSLLCLPSEQIQDYVRILLVCIRRASRQRPKQLEIILNLPIQNESHRREALLLLLQEAVCEENSRLITRLLQELQLTAEDRLRLFQHEEAKVAKWVLQQQFPSKAEEEFCNALRNRLQSALDLVNKHSLLNSSSLRRDFALKLDTCDIEQLRKLVWWFCKEEEGSYSYPSSLWKEKQQDHLDLIQAIVLFRNKHHLDWDCRDILAEGLESSSNLDLVKILLQLPPDN
ncbi:MAG: hypothetical protein AAGM67_17545, partial [Bacteroidota bacterium]